LKSNFASAQTYYQRVLKIQQAAFSPSSPELLPTLDGLSNLSLQQKQYTEAEPLLRKTLAIRETSFGPMHAEVAKNLDQLGSLYTEQKNYGAAVRCLERSVFIWTKALGSESPELAGKYQKLAEVYAALNRPVDAEPLVRQVLTTRESETVASLNTLASIYIARENLAEAEPLYRLSIAILDKRGILTAKKPVVAASDPSLELLADTAIDYVELLKKMKRKGEASKLEARIRAVVGKNYKKRSS
jgi:tetratricopeptide (TPR) repeat protein